MTLWTEDPRLVELYDVECAGRWDHDFYLALADRLDATAVVDVGCGTGVFAVDVATAAEGIRRSVVGVDPAQPMLDVAAARPGGELVQWICGEAVDVPSGSADLVIMMGHVAQYFVSDQAWAQVLDNAYRILRPGGSLAFEVRNPDRGWDQRWTEANTKSVFAHPEAGEFTSWVQVVEKVGPDDSYTMTHEGHSILPGGQHLASQETLRFRRPDEIISSVQAAGFVITETFGDWASSPFRSHSDELIVVADTLRPTQNNR